MTPTPVDRVSEMLKGAGFRLLPSPLKIAGLEFDLPAVLVGAPPSPDLVLVAETAFDQNLRIQKKIEGIARAMDVMRSRRPLTTVLVGPRPSTAVLEAMSRVCRVLPVGLILEKDADESLRNWLAVLLPLRLPQPGNLLADPLSAIGGEIAGLDAEVASLVSQAEHGAHAVEARLHELIREPFTAEFSDEEL